MHLIELMVYNGHNISRLQQKSTYQNQAQFSGFLLVVLEIGR